MPSKVATRQDRTNDTLEGFRSLIWLDSTSNRSCDTSLLHYRFKDQGKTRSSIIGGVPFYHLHLAHRRHRRRPSQIVFRSHPQFGKQSNDKHVMAWRAAEKLVSPWFASTSRQNYHFKCGFHGFFLDISLIIFCKCGFHGFFLESSLIRAENAASMGSTLIVLTLCLKMRLPRFLPWCFFHYRYDCHSLWISYATGIQYLLVPVLQTTHVALRIGPFPYPFWRCARTVQQDFFAPD